MLIIRCLFVILPVFFLFLITYLIVIKWNKTILKMIRVADNRCCNVREWIQINWHDAKILSQLHVVVLRFYVSPLQYEDTTQ